MKDVCIRKSHFLVLHQKLYNSAFGITYEASICTSAGLCSFWANNKVAVMMIFVGRTAASIIHTSFAKLYEFTNNINNACCIKNFIYDPSFYFGHI